MQFLGTLQLKHLDLWAYFSDVPRKISTHFGQPNKRPAADQMEKLTQNSTDQEIHLYRKAISKQTCT